MVSLSNHDPNVTLSGVEGRHGSAIVSAVVIVSPPSVMVSLSNHDSNVILSVVGVALKPPSVILSEVEG
jgi:hypothetical protein